MSASCHMNLQIEYCRENSNDGREDDEPFLCPVQQCSSWISKEAKLTAEEYLPNRNMMRRFILGPATGDPCLSFRVSSHLPA